MVRDPLSGSDAPDLDDVLEALSDDDCRRILMNLDKPRNANDLQERCDIPRSTLYRKLEMLTEASLLLEGTEIRSDGSHAGRYEVNFEQVIVGYEESGLTLEMDRPARKPEERLAELWTEVRKET